MGTDIMFISLKKGAALNLYDDRGFDLFSEDADFLRLMYKRFENYIIDYNREEIKKALNL